MFTAPRDFYDFRQISPRIFCSEAHNVLCAPGFRLRSTQRPEMDGGGDCSISWSEFRKALLGPGDDPEPPLPPDANVEALETYLRGIFDRVDTSGDGAISVSEAAAALRDDEEFAEVLGVDVGTDDVFRAIDALDEDGDQRVSWSEFRGAVLGATPWGAE